MKRTFLPLLLASASMLSNIAAPLNSELLFKDTFNEAAPTSDINANAPSRQSGRLAPLTYSTGTKTPLLGQDAYPNVIQFESDTLISPNHNFTEGQSFTIEFDIDPGVNDDPGDGLSGDWAAVVFGANSQNVFVTDGSACGVLFRNNGEIQTFAGGTAMYGGPGIPGGMPKDRKFHVRIDVKTTGFNGSPATVSMLIDGAQCVVGAGGATNYAKANGFQNNYITLEGYGFPGPWTHLFDELSISAVPDILVGSSTLGINRSVNAVSQPVSVQIPAQLNASAPAQIKVISSNPSIAVPTGADASGTLTLNYAVGGPLAQNFTVTGLASGVATMRIEGPADVIVNRSVTVFVVNGVGVSELLFKDNFDATIESLDVNFEIGAPRQTGVITGSGLSYLEAADSASGGANDHFTIVNSASYPAGKLLLISRDNGISPARNFNDGSEFYIEAEIHPGASVTANPANWAAIVFGTSNPNQFVATSDGFGILFRQNGAIEVWDGATRVYGSDPGSLPEAPFKVRIDASSVSYSGAPATIGLKVNDQVFPITATGATYIKPNGFRGNYVTLAGTGADLAHLFDDLAIGSSSCIHFRDSVLETIPGETVSATIRIPASLTATAPLNVRVRSTNPSTANASGAVGAETTINFPIGQSEATVSIVATKNGSTKFELLNDAGICTGEPLVVNSRLALVKNPSFERNYNPTFPSYSDINGWDKVGGTGVNTSSGPFADNGPIPDRDRAAFIQGNGRISQVINNLTVGKQYWIQFRYNTRNCCGTRSMALSTLIDEVEIDRIAEIQAFGPNEYGFRTVTFTAEATSVTLAFASAATGDATAVIDAVSITQRDTGNVIIQNPSFETSDDVPGNGVLTPKRLAGWTGAGTYGIAFYGASFADNGAPADQDHVAFLQGISSLTQTALRLTAGSGYKLEFAYNAPTGKHPHLKVKVGGAVVWEGDVDPVGGNNNYRAGSVDFIASGTSAEITFEQSAAGDQVVLLDNVRLLGQSITLPCLGISPAKLDLGLNGSGTFSVTVPPQLIATGPATIKLRSSDTNIIRLQDAAADGVLSVEFAQGGEVRQDVTIQTLGLGNASITVADAAGLCVDNGVDVSVIGSFIRNPSFETTPAGAFPGYGAIASWSGGSGQNNADGPFHDNGTIPDRKQIGFIQNSGSLSQEIANLEVGKTYWVQFRYNTRNCCNGPTIALSVQFNGIEIGNIPEVLPVGPSNPYNLGQFEFTPDATSGSLSFNTTIAGDGTLLLDAVNIVQRDPGQIVVINPSFEAEGTAAFPGYLQPDPLSGWSGTGSYGVNNARVGPFADNGRNPDQDSVAFLQNAGSSLSQHLTGLEAGQTYTLTFAANGRVGNSPRLRVSFDGANIHESDVPPVGGTNPYATRSVSFTAAGTEGDLKFEQVTAGDHTVVIDNIMVKAGGTPQGPTITASATGNTLRIAWPSSATGYVLYGASVVSGPYAIINNPVIVEGANNVVNVTIPSGAGQSFFKLQK